MSTFLVFLKIFKINIWSKYVNDLILIKIIKYIL